jgi:hypothetical protein
MMETGRDWPAQPKYEMELRAVRLLDGREIRVQSHSYGAEQDYVTIDVALKGTPLVLYIIAEIPISIVERMPDGHPVVLGEWSLEAGGGLGPAPDFPGVPDRGVRLYGVTLEAGGEIRIQAHNFRSEDGFVYFSVTCHTENSVVDYDLVSVPEDLVRHIAVIDQNVPGEPNSELSITTT